MELYRLILFAHIAGVVAMFSALALEALSMRRIAAATTYEQAREWSRVWALLLPIGLPALFTVLASGIYLATTVGAWKLGWVGPAGPSLLLVGIGGAVTGPRRKRLQQALASGMGPLPREVAHQVTHPIFSASLRWRTALLVGVLFVMTARPEGAGTLIALSALAALSVLWSAVRWKGTAALAP